MRVAIIDYGSGNLRSATRAFERAAREAGISAEIDLTADAERVRTADRIVLPGVGAYADCRAGLDRVPGMSDAVIEAAVARARPTVTGRISSRPVTIIRTPAHGTPG